MAVLRSARGPARGRGPRRGVHRPHRARPAPNAAARSSRPRCTARPACAARSGSVRASWWPRWPPTPTSRTASSSSRRRRPASASRTAPRGSCPASGPRRSERLESHGVTTLASLGSQPDELLTDWFGARLGPHLGRLARFEDARVLELRRVCASPSRARRPSTATSAASAQLEPVLERLTGQLCADLCEQGAAGRTIGIKVRLDDFSTVTRARDARRAGERARHGEAGRDGSCSRSSPGAAGAAAGRAGGRAGRGGDGTSVPPPPHDQLELSL